MPGNASSALLCAGWVAGRGPAGRPAGVRPPRRERLRSASPRPLAVAGAVAAIAVALVAAWTMWQPQRSVNAANDALESLEAGRVPEARADIRAARDTDPLSIEPALRGRDGRARRRQRPRRRAGCSSRPCACSPRRPSRGCAWPSSSSSTTAPQAALQRIGPALYLDPRSAAVQAQWLAASRAEAERRERAADRRRAQAGGSSARTP